LSLLAIRPSLVKACNRARQTARTRDDRHKAIRPRQSATRVMGGVIFTTTCAHVLLPQSRLGLAAAAGAAAVVLVVAVGLAVRAPLERVPENALKFVVGVLLTSFGIFWAGEGAGVAWPGSDVTVLGIVGYVGLVSLALTRLLRRRKAALTLAVAHA
jgi:hypothetical protein